jgi:hypothetical protein
MMLGCLLARCLICRSITRCNKRRDRTHVRLRTVYLASVGTGVQFELKNKTPQAFANRSPGLTQPWVIS